MRPAPLDLTYKDRMAKTRSQPTLELSRLIDDIDRTRGDQRYVPRAKPKKMGDLVAQLLARRGYAQETTAADITAAWQAAAGEQLARQTRVGMVRRGTLEVVVGNSAVSQELTFRKTQLLADLIARLPDHQIKNIRFRTGNV